MTVFHSLRWGVNARQRSGTLHLLESATLNGHRAVQYHCNRGQRPWPAEDVQPPGQALALCSRCERIARRDGIEVPAMAKKDTAR